MAGDAGPPPGHIPIDHHQEGLPTWEEAHSKSIPTIRHIPKAAREEWARTLGATVGDVIADIANPNKWLLLYILARCVLKAQPRELGAAGRTAAHRVKEVCRRWRSGEAAALWNEAKGEVQVQARRGRRRRPREEEPTLEERNARKATSLIQEGQLSRAARALTSRGMDQTSPQALQEMRDKHPQREELAELAEDEEEEGGQGEEQTVAPITISSREVYEAVRSFKPGTAPGPSGLRGEHLKEAKGRGEGRGAAALGNITRLVNSMAAGKLPKEVSPYLCGGNLYAAVKKSGGLRPVAVGDVFRRLVGKSIMYKVAGRAANILRPIQFGVGVRGGCEGVVHATRATLASQTIPEENLWSLQVDLVNGFNQGDRDKMREEVRRLFPELSPWVESCYGAPSSLNF